MGKNAAPSPMTKTEAQWRAEEDARTLQRSKLIYEDGKRFNAAMEAAKRMAKETRKEADTMEAVADKSSGIGAMMGAKK